METLDDAALLELLRDGRVNRHGYFATPVNVRAALAAVEGSGAEDVPLLLDCLVDQDPQDKSHIVRSETWLMLWTPTGRMHGAERDFATPPGCGGLGHRATRMRPGVTAAQRKEVEGHREGPRLHATCDEAERAGQVAPCPPRPSPPGA